MFLHSFKTTSLITSQLDLPIFCFIYFEAILAENTRDYTKLEGIIICNKSFEPRRLLLSCTAQQFLISVPTWRLCKELRMLLPQLKHVLFKDVHQIRAKSIGWRREDGHSAPHIPGVQIGRYVSELSINFIEIFPLGATFLPCGAQLCPEILRTAIDLDFLLNGKQATP